MKTLENFEKSIIKLSNPELEFDDFQNYKISEKIAKKLSKGFLSEPRNIEEMLDALSISVNFSLGNAMEILIHKDYNFEKLREMVWNSQVMNRAMNIVFGKSLSNLNKTKIGDKFFYVWIENIQTPIMSTNDMNIDELSDLASDLLGLIDILKNEDNSYELIFKPILEFIQKTINDIVDYELNKIRKSSSFLEKLIASFNYYKYYILGYGLGVFCMYAGLALFSIPVAGEVWTLASAAQSSIVETVITGSTICTLGAFI